ncbi:arylsulfatase J-like [Haliotis rufescens]|uniref:arylsulfatase J-like n=1 Tax=Haliotis rufescens TaxID=6454 RepID=UPI00201F2281|nr:arylsulfatase J-like [Haliotis rufescens]
MEKPNIVFIVADDLGWNDVGYRNPQMITPNLDRLAKAGVILNSSYVQPLCSPSRNCFMSCYFPYHTGLQDGVIQTDAAKFLPANLTTLPQKLKQLGYDAHMVGKWHLGFCNWKYTPTERGFDTYLGHYSGAEDYFTHMLKDPQGEVGLDFHLNKIAYREANGTYSAYVFANRAVEFIEGHNNTKATLWEGGTKGTGFIYSKTLLKKTGYLNIGMMHAVDWNPTLVELAGGENTDPNMDGVSQYDMLINGGPTKRNEFVYNIYDEEEAAAIRYGDLKLIQGSPGDHNGWAPLPHLGIDERVYQADNQKFPPFMLYNITADPTEHFDLSATYPELVDMMKKRLENWKKSRVPAQNNASIPAANPKYYGGVWSPGWC